MTERLHTDPGCGDPDCDECRATREIGREPSSRRCINRGRAVQTPALIKQAEPLQVTVDIADALGVGLSIRALINSGRIPASAVAPFDRVAEQLVAAARAAAGTVGR